MENTSDRAKIRSLHGLRGIMAWWVVIGHLSHAVGWNIPIIEKNTLAVDVFIILSGFVIALLVDRKSENYGRYVIRRTFRLYPLYILVLVVSSLMLPINSAALQYLPATLSNQNRGALLESALNNFIEHFGIHLVLFQGLVPISIDKNVAFTIVGQAWSISLEWQFYLVAPLLVALLLAKKWIYLGTAVVALSLAAPLFSVAFLGAKILLFILGMATHFSLKRKGGHAFIPIVFLCAVASIVKDGTFQLLPLAIWFGAIASSLRPVHSVGYLPARLLAARMPYHLGEISYSVYLLHMIPIYGAAYILGRLGVSMTVLKLGVACATILGTYIFAVAAYRWIEEPGIRLGAQLTKNVSKA